ncbi:MAG: hypothetical protein WDM96_18820 [Lacunisphaera sp.]
MEAPETFWNFRNASIMASGSSTPSMYLRASRVAWTSNLLSVWDPRSAQEENGGLEAVLDADGAVGPENGLHEKLLEAAGLRLRDDEKADAKHNAGQAHEHRPALGREEPEGDAEIGRHCGPAPGGD